MTQIFTARTVEDAKELAARTFGVPEEKISFEILEEPQKGFWGFVKKGEAKIKATYVNIAISEPEVAGPEEELPVISAEILNNVTELMSENATESMSENATKPMSENATESMSENATKPMSKNATESMSENATESMSENATKPMSENATKPMSENATESMSELPDDEELVAGEPSETALVKIEKAKTYLLSILNAMNIQAELTVNAGSESAIIEIVTKNSGAVIGKRGETLDALQYLIFMTANRSDKEYYRIILDTANYRERRRKTLEELATKIAKNVLQSHRSTTLEPMNPYERRIIHSAIAKIDGVASKSIGEDPYRKVVISSTEKPVRSGKRRNYHDKNDRYDKNRHNSRNRRRDHDRKNPDAPPTRISMDSMKTSFEKDYKRPKPEDDINAGLYGKIEF